MNDEQINMLVESVAHKFRTVGGGMANPNNPVSIALAEKPAQFAGGVSVKDVVSHVVNEARALKESADND